MNDSRSQKTFIFMVATLLSLSMFGMTPKVGSKVFQPSSAITSTLCIAMRHASGKNNTYKSKAVKKKQKLEKEIETYSYPTKAQALANQKKFLKSLDADTSLNPSVTELCAREFAMINCNVAMHNAWRRELSRCRKNFKRYLKKDNV